MSKKVGSIHDTQILNIIFVILTDDSSVITNDTQGTPGNIYITRNNYVQQGTKITFLFLPTTGEASWLLLKMLDSHYRGPALKTTVSSKVNSAKSTKSKETLPSHEAQLTTAG